MSALIVPCWHCEQPITSDDPADAWRLHMPLDPAFAYACPSSPNGEHEPTVCRACGGVEYGPCWACPPSLPGKPSGLDVELRRFLP